MHPGSRTANARRQLTRTGASSTASALAKLTIDAFAAAARLVALGGFIAPAPDSMMIDPRSRSLALAARVTLMKPRSLSKLFSGDSVAFNLESDSGFTAPAGALG